MAETNYEELKSFALAMLEEGEKRQEAETKAAREVKQIGGVNYVWNEGKGTYIPLGTYIPDDPLFPSELKFFTMDGMVDYIKADVEGLVDSASKLILQVCNETEIVLWAHPSVHMKYRRPIARCTATIPYISFSSYMDSDTFNTTLLSNFVKTHARDMVFQMIKSMTKQQTLNTTDDGVSQMITVKSGVSSVSNVQFENPVPLRPIRTFPELEQPESDFTLRVDNEARIALFEADGGLWKNTAVKEIKEYLEEKLKGVDSVIVLA